MRKKKVERYPNDRVLVIAENWLELPDLCDGGASAATAIAAGVSALASAGSGIAMVSKKRGTTRMMNVSKELAKFNNDLAISNWERENAYNSPAAQMQRYKEAGLNPNLIYGQQNTSGSIQSGAVDTSPGQYTQDDKYSQALQKFAGAAAVYQDIIGKTAQINNTDASTDAIRTSAALDAARKRGQDIQNEYTSDMMSHQLEGLRIENAHKAIKLENDRIYEGAERRAGLLKTKEDIYNTKMDTTKKSKEIARIDGEIGLIDQQISESKARVHNMEEGIRIGYGNLGVAQFNAQTGRMNAETNKFNADINSYNAYTQRYLGNENLSLKNQQFQHSKLMDMANYGLKLREFNFTRGLAFQKSMPQISPFPFVKFIP